MINKKRTKDNITYITEAGLVAALYIVLTIIFKPISYGAIQVRISEMLVILPLFFGSAVPGLFVGCFIANMIGGAGVFDVIFGSLATLIGAMLTYKFKNRSPYIAPIWPIVSNSIIIPIELYYFYGVDKKLWVIIFFIFIGEFISCGVLGMGLYKVLNRFSFFNNRTIK